MLCVLNPSKFPKTSNTREVSKDRSIAPGNTEETTMKDDPPQEDDVPQAKATVTLEQEVTETVDISSELAKPTPTSAEQDQIDADTLIATAIATATTENNNDIINDDTTQQDTGNDLEEKSPLLTAAPSSSSSSDTSSSRLNEQQEPINLPPPTSTNGNSTANGNNSSSNGTGVNGYWQAPATNSTFQHSMGWPELFPLQQQDGDQIKHATSETTATKDVYAAPEEKKKSTKKRMSRPEQINQQRQNYIPSMKSRCNWWPNCTNKNCKYHHPYQPCRYGDLCIYNERCMFLHPWDYDEPVRQTKQQQQQEYQHYQQYQQYQQYQPYQQYHTEN
ncbi:unnamed protein product [Absidia cylindrospora]